VQENAGRLKGYKANLVLFPRHGRKPKAGEATAEERGAAVQLAGKTLMALPRSKPEVETVEITEEMQVCTTARLRPAQGAALQPVGSMVYRSCPGTCSSMANGAVWQQSSVARPCGADNREPSVLLHGGVKLYSCYDEDTQHTPPVYAVCTG